MYYTIYKITNHLTGEYYIGQHQTNDINDGYMGSGPGIVENIKEHGKDNFLKEILFVFDTKSEMNDKEIEMISDDILQDPLCLNRQGGGYHAWNVRNSIVIFDEGSKKWKRIRKSEYDPDKHITPTSNTITVYDILIEMKRRIPTTEYHKNKDRYRTAGTGKVSVYNKSDGKSMSIPIEEYDSTIHTKVLGGIVASINGRRQYVSKEMFDKENLVGCHKNKVTVTDTYTGERKHVSVEEYRGNKDRYKTSGLNTVSVYDTEEGIRKRVDKGEFNNNRERYRATTHGQKTVWDIEQERFLNIPKGDFDRKIHRLASDKMIICISENGKTLIDFWGSKKDFVKMYGFGIYTQALNETQNFQPLHRNKYAAYIGCSFKIIDWSNQNERHKKRA